MPESQLVLPKPRMVVKMVLGDNQAMDVKTDRYTLEELEELMDNSRGTPEPLKFWGSDENDEPVRVVIQQPEKLIAYVVIDFESFKKTMLQAQFHAAQQRGPMIQR